MNLAFAANAGNADWCNQDAEKIAAVTPESLKAMAKQILRKENCSTMYYKSSERSAAAVLSLHVLSFLLYPKC